jgi:Bacterial Ig domain
MKINIKLLAGALAITSMTAQAELNLTGPVSPVTGNFPVYFQDTNGLGLDLCLPAPGPERTSGMCILADLPNPNAAISFPGNFPDESFWWMGDSSLTLPDGSNAILVMAMEAAFANEIPVAGDQVVFARIRIRFVAPTTGHYKVTHPYGVEEFEAVAGERVFITDDHGALCGTDFTCAAGGRIGPFLRPSVQPGGEAMAPIVVEGKTYIADPGVSTNVTGSPFDTNIFRIEGPDGVSESDQFTLMGRVHTDPLPSNTNIESATYSRSSNGHSLQIDVHAKSVKALGQPDQRLRLFGEGIPGISMQKNPNNATKFYGQLALYIDAVPPEIYLSDLNETPNRVFSAKLVDQITINKAVYDSDAQKLHIEADSSDNFSGNLPIMYAQGSNGVDFGHMYNGVLDVQSVVLPPAKVIVRSNHGGRSEQAVTATLGAPTLSSIVTNHDLDVDENYPINVLANDLNQGGQCKASAVKVMIVKQPAHGDVTVNSTDQTVSYTQKASVNDKDSFSYYVTDLSGNSVSNVSTVNFDIVENNLPPVANPDLAEASVGASITINPLANDSDPENANLVLVSVTGAGATKDVNTIRYVATAPLGAKTLQYVVTDGNATATGAITVNVDAAELVTITTAEYRRSKSQWRITGTDTPVKTGVVMKVYSNNGNFLLGTTTTDATGAWDFRSVSAQRAGPIVVKSERGSQASFALTVRN